MIACRYCNKSQYVSRCGKYYDHVDSCSISYTKGFLAGTQRIDIEDEKRKYAEENITEVKNGPQTSDFNICPQPIVSHNVHDKIVMYNGEVRKFITGPIKYLMVGTYAEAILTAQNFVMGDDFKNKKKIDEFMDKFLTSDGEIEKIIRRPKHYYHKPIVQLLSNIIEILSSAARDCGEISIAKYIEQYLPSLLPRDDIMWSDI